MSRTSYAHLPLHGGKAPRWLFECMVPLSREALNGARIDRREKRQAFRRLADFTGQAG